MASPESIAIKKANAVQAIQQASTALAEKFGIELPELPSTIKFEPEYARAVELEHLANVMQSLAIASKASSAKDYEFDNVVGQKPPPPKVEAAPAPPMPAPGGLVHDTIPAKDVPKTVKKAAKAVAPIKVIKKGGK